VSPTQVILGGGPPPPNRSRSRRRVLRQRSSDQSAPVRHWSAHLFHLFKDSRRRRLAPVAAHPFSQTCANAGSESRRRRRVGTSSTGWITGRWVPSVRVNAETSPSGYVNQDDFSHIALDAYYAHLAWEDRRMVSKVADPPLGTGGLQVYYGRVPLATVCGGATCGRS